jgi:alpha-tubulin suppressor-like RCC1 family protein
VNISATLGDGCLLYSWGNAACGKLGIGILSKEDCERRSEFNREDVGSRTNEEFASRSPYYTHKPQPIVSFLGTKVRSVCAGMHHFLALTASGDLYAWGDNSCFQLGLSADNLVLPGNKERRELFSNANMSLTMAGHSSLDISQKLHNSQHQSALAQAKEDEFDDEIASVPLNFDE